jgi:hypothetical protein
MSQFISLRILASIALGHSKETSRPEAPSAPSLGDRQGEPIRTEREEPSSASPISVNRVHAQPAQP